MVTLKQVAETARPGLPAAREALRGRQRLGQTRQLLVRQLDPGQPARSGRDAARQRAVPGVLRRRHPRRAQVRRAPARRHRHRQPTITAWAPTKRRPAIISIFLGEQLSDVFEQIRAGRRQVVQDGRHAGDRRRLAAQAAARRRRSQPHQPVRLHGQPLRVPRGRLQPVDRRSAGRAEHGHRRVVRLHRDQARGRGRQRQEAERRDPGGAGRDHPAARRRRVRRQRLLGRVARRGREARPAELQDRGRRAAGPAAAGGRRRCSTSTRCCRRASCTAATRSTSSSTARR